MQRENPQGMDRLPRLPREDSKLQAEMKRRSSSHRNLDGITDLHQRFMRRR